MAGTSDSIGPGLPATFLTQREEVLRRRRFFDSTAEAAEASEGLLAHVSRSFDQRAEMYGVIGDLSSGIPRLRQVRYRLADVARLHGRSCVQ